MYLLIYKYVIVITISDTSKPQIKLNMVGLKANIAYAAMLRNLPNLKNGDHTWKFSGMLICLLANQNKVKDMEVMETTKLHTLY